MQKAGFLTTRLIYKICSTSLCFYNARDKPSENIGGYFLLLRTMKASYLAWQEYDSHPIWHGKSMIVILFGMARVCIACHYFGMD